MLCAAERQKCSFTEDGRKGAPVPQSMAVTGVIFSDGNVQETHQPSMVEFQQNSSSIPTLQVEVSRLCSEIAQLHKEKEDIREEVSELWEQQVSMTAILEEVQMGVEDLVVGMLNNNHNKVKAARRKDDEIGMQTGE